MPVPGKLEVTIKINAMPADAITDANGWKPLWVAAISGGMGPRTADGFELAEPNIQVFERKAKPDPVAAPPAAG